MDLHERVARVLAEEVAPALGMDGIGVQVIEITEDGVARLRLTAGCLSCPGTLMTVIHGLEQELCRRLPEIECVECVQAD